MKKAILLLVLFGGLLSCKNVKEEKGQADRLDKENAMNTRDNKEMETDSVPVMPVEHASFAMILNKKVLYFDPVGSDTLYKNLPQPDVIFLTHAHPDHLDPKTLSAFLKPGLLIIAPKAVKDALPANLQAKVHLMGNGDTKSYFDITVTAIPMYNLREEAKKYHPKGKGNGYVLSYGNHKIYVAGDTEDTPEMRELRHITLAFIPMNLPYTMPIDSAISAVLEFKPDKVYPYHYRGQDGYSDVGRFKKEVEEKNPDIHVQLLDWYPNRKDE